MRISPYRLGIIVPYRNRYEHLERFKTVMTTYLDYLKIKYELIIVEQDDAKQFNRGMLLNIGFKIAKEKKCHYVVFHDVDMLPVGVDYSYSEIPLHLSTNFITEEGEKERILFDTYFGGVTLFPVKDFEEIDGYSNKYWGWGYEDDDLLFRCKEKMIPLNTLKIKNLGKKGKALKFNGINSYIKSKNVIDFNSNFTIFVSFYPDELELNYLKEWDEFTIFSIPGYDFAISYSSFKRYNFCTFDNKKNALYVNSNIKTNYKTNFAITSDAKSKTFKVYQDGKFIGETQPYKKLYNYSEQPNFYLGVGNPEREGDERFFKGYIDSFAYYDSLLSENEILEISTTSEDFRKLESNFNLKTYYDANHIIDYKLKDLSRNKNIGEINGCEIVDLDFDEYTEIQIPHRRPSTFHSLKHEENGFINNAWKDKATRWNQLRFENEVSKHSSLITRDGISTLDYAVHGIIENGKITQVNVAI
jgi:hypothetical protein